MKEHMEPLFRLAAKTEVFALDTSLPGKPLLVSVYGRHFQVGALAAEVFSVLDETFRPASDLEKMFQKKHGRAAIEDLESTLTKLADRGIISRFHGDGAVTIARPKSYFAVKMPIFSPTVLRPITRLLAPLFSPHWMLWVLPALLLFQVVFCIFHYPSANATLRSNLGTLFISVLAGNYVGLFFHELGHASACVQCGIKHGSIGFALYLVFPAMYTDVSEAWRLPRYKRMVVDAGGIYASLIAATLASILFFATGQVLFVLLATLYDLTVLVNLNPFIRMDAYWLFSDLLGVQNLMSANREMSAWLLRRIARIKPATRPRILGLSSRLQCVYLVYYCLSLLFLFYISVRFSIWYIPKAITQVPEILRDAVASGATDGLSMQLLHDFLRLTYAIVPAIALFAYLIPRGLRLIRNSGEP
jgi:putative peptide zinc metalloprotease protein